MTKFFDSAIFMLAVIALFLLFYAIFSENTLIGILLVAISIVYFAIYFVEKEQKK